MISRNLIVPGLAIMAGSIAMSGSAQAGKNAPYVSNSETIFSIGIQYDFGDMQFDLVGAARATKTDTDNDVTGAKMDITIPLTGDNHSPTLRAMGLAGSTDVQGEAGIGYDFAKSQALIGAGAQGPYVNGGINYYFGGLLAPYLGANTLDGAPERDIREPL